MGMEYNTGHSAPDPLGHNVPACDPRVGPLLTPPDTTSRFRHDMVSTLIDMRQQPGRCHGRITVEPGLPLLR